MRPQLAKVRVDFYARSLCRPTFELLRSAGSFEDDVSSEVCPPTLPPIAIIMVSMLMPLVIPVTVPIVIPAVIVIEMATRCVPIPFVVATALPIGLDPIGIGHGRTGPVTVVPDPPPIVWIPVPFDPVILGPGLRRHEIRSRGWWRRAKGEAERDLCARRRDGKEQQTEQDGREPVFHGFLPIANWSTLSVCTGSVDPSGAATETLPIPPPLSTSGRLLELPHAMTSPAPEKDKVRGASRDLNVCI